MLGSLPLLEKALWLLSALLTTALLLRLYRLELIRGYPAFCCALGVELLQMLALAAIPYRTDAYAIGYMITEPLVWTARTAVTLEIYRGVLKGYQGIWVLGRRSLMAALGVSLAIALLTMGPEWRFSTDLYPILLGFSLAGKTVLLVLLLFLTLLFAFLAWYPIALPANLVRYALGFALLLLVQAAGLWVRNVQGLAQIRLISQCLMAAPVLIAGFWLSVIDRKGEALAASLRRNAGEVERERLLAQLDQLNRALAGSRPIG